MFLLQSAFISSFWSLFFSPFLDVCYAVFMLSVMLFWCFFYYLCLFMPFFRFIMPFLCLLWCLFYIFLLFMPFCGFFLGLLWRFYAFCDSLLMIDASLIFFNAFVVCLSFDTCYFLLSTMLITFLPYFFVFCDAFHDFFFVFSDACLCFPKIYFYLCLFYHLSSDVCFIPFFNF